MCAISILAVVHSWCTFAPSTDVDIDIDIAIDRLADGSAVEVEEHHLLPLLQRQLDAAFFPGGGGGGAGAGGANHPVDAAYDAAYTYDAAVVLCAGAFGGLTLQSLPTPLQAALPSPSTPQAPIPVISPFEEAAAVLRARTDAAAAGATLFVPSDAQQPFALARWRGRGGVARFAAPGVLSAATIVHDGETEAEQIVRHLRRGAYGPTGTESTVILDFVGHSPALADELRLRLPGRMVLDVGAVAVQQVVKAVCGGVPVPSKG